MMNIKHYPPSDILKPYIKSYIVIESEDGTVNRVLPETSVVMALRLKGRVTVQEEQDRHENKLPVSVVTGLRTSPRLITYSKQSATLLVIFREGGAAAFFKDPLHELFGLHLSLDSLVRRSAVDEVEERLAETKNIRQKIAVIERFLLARWREPQSDPIVFHAIQRMRATHGDISIKELVEPLPISRDPFEKRFRRLTGTSPKRFSGIIRMRNVIENYSQDQSLTDAAYLAGYFDQSHFIKDFKSFTGQTPKDFFESPSFW